MLNIEVNRSAEGVERYFDRELIRWLNNDIAELRQVTDSELVLHGGRRMRRNGARIDCSRQLGPIRIGAGLRLIDVSEAPSEKRLNAKRSYRVCAENSPDQARNGINGLSFFFRNPG